MTTTHVLTDQAEDEDIIELTEEIESEDEEIIDLTDGIDPILEQTTAPVEPTPAIATAADPAPSEIRKWNEGSESGKSFSIEELTIDSLDEEIPALDIDAPSAEPPVGAQELDIDIDLDRLLPDTVASVPPSKDAPTTDFEPVHEKSSISLDAFLSEESTDLSSEPILDIGLPLSGEPPLEAGVVEASDGMQPIDIVPPPAEPAATVDMMDRISDERIDRAVERVIREMFEERISAAIYEVVERVVQDEMDRLRRLLIEDR